MPTISQLALARKELPPVPIRSWLRAQAGVSQQELALEMKVNRAAVSRWERGIHSPRGRHLVAYSALLVQLREIASQ